MQEGVINTSGDINSVVTAVGLHIGVCEGIANLKAVFPATTVERRLDSWTKANRVVVLIPVQLDALSP